jgi:ABC-type glycerol-3-phosphate transport system substrate-binding protein
MKKVFFAIAAIVATMTIASCGNGTTSQTETADSTAVQVDTIAVDTTVVDTTTLAPAAPVETEVK